MKKSFLRVLMLVCLIIPCFFILSACKDENKEITFKFDLTSARNAEQFVGIDFYDINTYSKDNAEPVGSWTVGSDIEEVKFEKGVKYLCVLSASEHYELGELKIYIAGEEITLSKISDVLTEANNSAATDFTELNECNAFCFTVDEKSQQTVDVSFSGKTQPKKYQITIRENLDYTKPGYAPMIFQLSIDGEVVKNQAEQEFYNAEDFATIMKSLETMEFVAGTKLVVKAGFEDRNYTFNAGDFIDFDAGRFNLYSFRSYYDEEEKLSFYTYNCNADIEIIFNNYAGDEDYTKAGLYMSGVASQVLDTPELIPVAEIVENGAVFTVEDFSLTDYKVMMKEYTTAAINLNPLTQQQKEEIFSWSDGTLTCNFGKVTPIGYAFRYAPDVLPGKYLHTPNGNLYNVYFSVEEPALRQDNTIGKLGINVKYGEEVVNYGDMSFHEFQSGEHFSIEHETTQSCFRHMNSGDEPKVALYDMAVETVELRFRQVCGSNGTQVSKIELDIDGEKITLNIDMDTYLFETPIGSVAGLTIEVDESEPFTFSMFLTKQLITSLSHFTVEYFTID